MVLSQLKQHFAAIQYQILPESLDNNAIVLTANKDSASKQAKI